MLMISPTMALGKHSTVVEATAVDYDNIESLYNTGIVVFDVGGRIFKVRRTVLDKYPDTMLARSASELWNTNMVSILAATAITEESDSNRNDTKSKPEPIFIDRDSDRFACVLDFMRNNGSIELPVNISRGAFLRDLEYYGFDETNVDHTYITCTVPAYEALMKIDKLHLKFYDEVVQMKIKKDYKILAYACFCEFLQKYDLKCIITAPQIPNSRHYDYGTSTERSEYKLPSSMDILWNKISKNHLITGFELIQVAGTLIRSTKGINVDKNMKLFNKFLSEYGFACESVSVVGQLTATINLKRID